MVSDLFSGRSLTIDGLHVIILDHGLISVPPIMRRVRHRYVLCSAKRDAVQFSQLREREGAICSYFELESGGFLCSWYHQTEFRPFNLYEPRGVGRRIVVAEIISGTDFQGSSKDSTRSLRRFSENYWGILRVTHQWSKIRGGMLAIWEEACETSRRMNKGE